jgi:hypothetical protein
VRQRQPQRALARTAIVTTSDGAQPAHLMPISGERAGLGTSQQQSSPAPCIPQMQLLEYLPHAVHCTRLNWINSVGEVAEKLQATSRAQTGSVM